MLENAAMNLDIDRLLSPRSILEGSTLHRLHIVSGKHANEMKKKPFMIGPELCTRRNYGDVPTLSGVLRTLEPDLRNLMTFGNDEEPSSIDLISIVHCTLRGSFEKQYRNKIARSLRIYLGRQ